MFPEQLCLMSTKRAYNKEKALAANKQKKNRRIFTDKKTDLFYLEQVDQKSAKMNF